MAERSVLVVLGMDIVLYHSEAISQLPEWDKRVFIEGTAESIVALQIMEPVFPVMVPSSGDPSIAVMIEERRRGLAYLGVADIEREIDRARERIQARYDVNHVKQAIIHLGNPY